MSLCNAGISALGFCHLVRVLTLGMPDPNHPERSVQNGLGFMENPTKQLVEARKSATDDWTVVEQIVDPHRLEQARSLAAEAPHQRVRLVTVWEQLANPQLWLAAAGQIFFSLSVRFGVIITYASYLRKKMTSCSVVWRPPVRTNFVKLLLGA